MDRFTCGVGVVFPYFRSPWIALPVAPYYSSLTGILNFMCLPFPLQRCLLDRLEAQVSPPQRFYFGGHCPDAFSHTIHAFV